MKTRVRLLTAALVIAIGVLTLPTTGDETKKLKQTQDLDELLKLRRETLGRLVETVTQEYRHGTTEFESVARATDQLIEAELDLAENAEARIAILQRRVELMKDSFSMVEARFEAGQVKQSQFLAARAALLKAQIHLAREKADVGKPEKQ